MCKQVLNWIEIENEVENNEMMEDNYVEHARKDVERAFRVLQSRFAIIRSPSLGWDD